MSFQIAGLDKLQRDLEQAQRAFKSLDGEITRLTFEPGDQRSIDAALRQLDNAIDAKVMALPRQSSGRGRCKGPQGRMPKRIFEACGRSQAGSAE